MTTDPLTIAREKIGCADLLVTFSGAGLSTESGIPTFRDASTGLWANYDPAKLASQEGFQADRRLVIEWYGSRRKMIAEAPPNPAHIAIADFETWHPGRIVNITQNIDGLLQRAGASSVLELHGTLFEDRCNSPHCSHRQPVDLDEEVVLVDCPRCGAPMRPAVVWFGEMLPQDVWRQSDQACRRCDVLLVIGTSGAVYPAAGLVDVAKAHGASVIIVNPEPTPLDHLADAVFHEPAARIVPGLLEDHNAAG
ncbi:MAG: NAD-dependent deacylase [Phycisphaerales bacterium]|nr:NAD-dependent deacylase [Phycisphaerales bacterium]